VVTESTGPEGLGAAETVTPVNRCFFAGVPMYTVPFSLPVQDVVVVVDDEVVDDEVVDDEVVDDEVVDDDEDVVVLSTV
jgi:hypothetical protein